MTRYLSIDMDYFFNSRFEWESDFEFIKEKVNEIGLPVNFILSHEEIIEDLNKGKYDEIYNIDYHSDIDIEDEYLGSLDEGNWANYYIYKDSCVFNWRLPDREYCYNWGEGFCHGSTLSFPRSRMPYKKVHAISGLDDIRWTTIKGVSVCLSHNWVTPYGGDLYYTWKEEIIGKAV